MAKVKQEKNFYISARSFVTFELFDEDGKTRLKLTHEGLATFPVTANNDFAKINFEEGWAHITGKSLKEFVEK